MLEALTGFVMSLSCISIAAGFALFALAVKLNMDVIKDANKKKEELERNYGTRG